MILSGLTIQKEIKNGNIVIDPFDESLLNPNSYNLHLAEELLVYKRETLDMTRPNEAEQIQIPEEGFVFQPGVLYLGRTLEYTETRNYIPMLEGRSSVGRLGLFVHVTAGFGDVGFKGFWTLELHCVKPIRVYAGVEICQIYYHTILGDYVSYDHGKYQNNQGIQPSLMYLDFNRTDKVG